MTSARQAGNSVLSFGAQGLEKKISRQLGVAGVVVSTAPTGFASTRHRDIHGTDKSKTSTSRRKK